MSANPEPLPSVAIVANSAAELKDANCAPLKRLAVVVVGMFGFGYLLVPFYEKICEVTFGYYRFESLAAALWIGSAENCRI